MASPVPLLRGLIRPCSRSSSSVSSHLTRAHATFTHGRPVYRYPLARPSSFPPSLIRELASSLKPLQQSSSHPSSSNAFPHPQTPDGYELSTRSSSTSTDASSTDPSGSSSRHPHPDLSTPAVARWLYFTSFLTFSIVVVGGLTRLTESGLSITEWKPVKGMMPPRGPAEWEQEFAKYRDSEEGRMYV